MKSLRRLSGLFLVSLFLASTWISSLPGAEDPWDENKVVQSDSSTALGHGGLMAPDDTHIAVYVDVISLLKGMGLRILRVPEVQMDGMKSSKCGRVPLREVELRIDSGDCGDYRKARK